MTTRIAAHESTLIDTLYQECAGSLLRFFTRRHGSEDAARDLVQETFLQLARSPLAAGQSLSPRAYVFGIARHLSIAHWRQQRPASAHEDELLSVAAPQADPSVEAAREVIAAMPGLQREILDLRLHQGLSYQEIAGVLAIPVGTVRSRLHHAVEALRTAIRADDSDTPPSL